ncbi:PREDICTED: collagen alpha-1(VII) chain, partial [Thamnophis sirtalis]|uniref:Collagen alpha-1(VII) chain n=1 Tax=Thamnophis sirtalis TaxID=35019 RepID=A0A6I9Y3W6_9SAUR
MIRSFMEGLVVPFINVVGESGVRYAAVQYSDDPRTEFKFSDFLNGTEVIRAVQEIAFKGGNTRTGAGLRYVADNLFGANELRPNIPKICILITDGKSQDEVEQTALKLKNQGIKVFAVGIKNADRKELDRVASTPTEDYSFYVNDFKILASLLPLVSQKVCASTGGILQTIGAYNGPSNLVFMEQGRDMLRIRWTAAGGPVIGYKIQYVPLTGLGQQIMSERQEVSVGSGETSTVLRGLKSGTDYLVTVIAQYANRIGESVSGKGRTQMLSGVTNFRVLETGPFFLRLSWAAELNEALQGYRLTYVARDGTERVRRIPGSQTTEDLVDLTENVSYVVRVSALIGNREGNSVPLNIQIRPPLVGSVSNLRMVPVGLGRIRLLWTPVPRATAYKLVIVNTQAAIPIQPVGNLRVIDSSQTRIRLEWSPARGSTGYRLIWRPAGGPERSQLLPAHINTYVIEDLQPGGRYDIRITSLSGNRESEAVAIVATTGGEEAQRTLPASETSHRVSGLHLGEQYTFMIRPLFGSISGAEVSISGQTVCPDAQRDVIFLVHTTRDKAYNAEAVQSFLSNIISTLRPGPETTRVGIAMYSYRGLHLLLLNRSNDLASLLQHIRSLRYEERSGNAIGAGINFVKNYMLSPTAGRRSGVPGTLVILADESSSDDATGPAREIKAA